jgi:hypothetical protein
MIDDPIVAEVRLHRAFILNGFDGGWLDLTCLWVKPASAQSSGETPFAMRKVVEAAGVEPFQTFQDEVSFLPILS